MRQIDARVEEAPPPTVFDALYEAEYGPMVRVAFLMVGEGGRAEEIVQDAFAKVYERLDRLDRPAAYLRTAVVNGCRDVLRRRRLAAWRRPDPPEPAVQPDEYLADALAVLSPSRRAVVVLRYYADLSESQIAAVLGVRPGTVKSMLHRSLRQLREVVER